MVVKTELVATDIDSSRRFGVSVAIEAILMAVGTDSMAVYLFSLNDKIWTQTQKIVPPDIAETLLSVAISGNSMVIGSSRDTTSFYTSGSVNVYRRENGDDTWDFERKLPFRKPIRLII